MLLHNIWNFSSSLLMCSFFELDCCSQNKEVLCTALWRVSNLKGSKHRKTYISYMFQLLRKSMRTGESHYGLNIVLNCCVHILCLSCLSFGLFRLIFVREMLVVKKFNTFLHILLFCQVKFMCILLDIC